MTTAIYPGSFDPVTVGHLDIVRRASKLFDRVIVAVLVNMEKRPWFTIDERTELLKKATKDIPNVEIASFDGLLVDFAAQKNASAIVKGLRAVSDFEYEYQLDKNNEILAPDVKTIFLTSKPEHNFISSSGVKEILSYNGDLSKLVPDAVIKLLSTTRA